MLWSQLRRMNWFLLRATPIHKRYCPLFPWSATIRKSGRSFPEMYRLRLLLRRDARFIPAVPTPAPNAAANCRPGRKKTATESGAFSHCDVLLCLSLVDAAPSGVRLVQTCRATMKVTFLSLRWFVLGASAVPLHPCAGASDFVTEVCVLRFCTLSPITTVPGQNQTAIK